VADKKEAEAAPFWLNFTVFTRFFSALKLLTSLSSENEKKKKKEKILRE